jgi:hypothetical protein
MPHLPQIGAVLSAEAELKTLICREREPHIRLRRFHETVFGFLAIMPPKDAVARSYLVTVGNAHEMEAVRPVLQKFSAPEASQPVGERPGVVTAEIALPVLLQMCDGAPATITHRN